MIAPLTNLKRLMKPPTSLPADACIMCGHPSGEFHYQYRCPVCSTYNRSQNFVTTRQRDPGRFGHLALISGSAKFEIYGDHTFCDVIFQDSIECIYTKRNLSLDIRCFRDVGFDTLKHLWDKDRFDRLGHFGAFK